jgi:hypothetical protein
LCNSNDVVTSISLLDGDGNYTVMSPFYAVTVSNNLTITNLAARVAAAINSTASNPQFIATASGTNVLLYEPRLLYPNTGCSVTVNYASTTNLYVQGITATLPLLTASMLPTSGLVTVTNGLATWISTNLTLYANGGQPSYSYSWSVALTNTYFVNPTAVYITNATANTAQCVVRWNPGIHGSAVTNFTQCVVTDVSGAKATNVSAQAFYYP